MLPNSRVIAEGENQIFVSDSFLAVDTRNGYVVMTLPKISDFINYLQNSGNSIGLPSFRFDDTYANASNYPFIIKTSEGDFINVKQTEVSFSVDGVNGIIFPTGENKWMLLINE